MQGARLRTAAQLLCLCAAALAAAPGPQFLVTAPGIVRPGANITIGVDLLEHSPPQVTVKAELFQVASNLSVSVLEGEGVFERGSFKTLILPSLPLNSPNKIYELHVTGRAQDEILFSNRTRLSFETKRISVFIQTDKALYKPKQEVKFRIVTLFSDFKPYKTSLNILIKDPKSNLIQQWLAQQSVLGVVSKTFQLSSHPILGDWSIQVQVNDQLYYQSFQVSEYVLPKFEVTLQTPLYCYMNSKNLNGTVTAKYTYGKPVKGDVTLTFLPLSFWGVKKNITKKFEINGSANFSFNDEEMKNVMDFSNDLSEDMEMSLPGPVEIFATVTESLTGISRNASSNVFFKQHEYIIEFFDYPTVLKPSLNFTATVKVTRFDGNRLTVEERRNNMVLTVTQRNYTEHWSKWNMGNQRGEAIQIINYTIPENGMVKVEFPVLDDSSQLQLKAYFLESTSNMAVHSMFTSPTKTYLQLTTRDENDVLFQVGSPFELVVTGNGWLKELSYMVVSKRQLVAVGKQNSTTFSLTPENSWAPKACIIVYYVEDNGEIINAVLQITVQLVFKNKIKLFWSNANARPAEKVSLRISVTQPGSIVGIVAVDKSVNLMNASNDITMENVVQDLELYNTGYYLGMFMNSFAVFQECGLWVLTDANLIEDYTDIAFDSMLYAENFVEESNAVDLDDFSSISIPRVRKHFPETWIWLDTNMGYTFINMQSYDLVMTHSLRNWYVLFFCINCLNSFNFSSTAVKLQAFQPFFIFLNLPYSIIRGEEFVLEVTIFNYLKDATEVKVNIEESDKFDILMTSNEVNASGHQQTIGVPSEDGATVLFPIKPRHLGEIPITVTAVSPTASDALTQKILVKAEGIEKSYSQSVLLDLTDNKLQSTMKTLSFSFPPDTVSGSERVQITAIGDVLGFSIHGLASLIRMPYGCGEQNMINFAPNIYILDYLTKKRQLTDTLKEKALSFMRQGYQRELLYQREDGSFSAFGDDDPSGSTWCFLGVLRFHFGSAGGSADILQQWPWHQLVGGSSLSLSVGVIWGIGNVYQTKVCAGFKPATLVIYIYIYFFFPSSKPNIDVQDSINFLEAEFSRGISDNYTLALITYALSSVGSPKAQEALNVLTQRAEHEEGTRFWVSSASKLSDSWQPRSLDIEVAAYTLLSHFRQFQLSEGIPIMKWLSSQRNSLGGFASTQDTIVALKALSEFAALMNTERTDIQVTVMGPSSPSPVKFLIDAHNRFLLQTAELAVLQPMDINISASGFGFAICQLNVVYNVKDSGSSRRRRSISNQEAFDLDVTVKDNKDDANHVNLNVCTRFRGPDRSGMALMEVNLLSGFTVPSDAIPLSQTVKKVEHDHGKLNVYLDSVNETQFCVDIPAVRSFKVSNTQDASVSIVDYYEPRRHAVRSYNAQAKLSSCDLCRDVQGCSPCADGASEGSSVLFTLCLALLFSVQHWP
uniref:CD109 molecule n=1 Tax=Otolemur garnettii TaxID=30611 RepID=H0WZ02_OTOGA